MWMLDHGNGESPNDSYIHTATKLVVDYRGLNEHMGHDNYLLPLIEDMLHGQFKWRIPFAFVVVFFAVYLPLRVVWLCGWVP